MASKKSKKNKNYKALSNLQLRYLHVQKVKKLESLYRQRYKIRSKKPWNREKLRKTSALIKNKKRQLKTIYKFAPSLSKYTTDYFIPKVKKVYEVPYILSTNSKIERGFSRIQQTSSYKGKKFDTSENKYYYLNLLNYHYDYIRSFYLDYKENRVADDIVHLPVLKDYVNSEILKQSISEKVRDKQLGSTSFRLVIYIDLNKHIFPFEEYIQKNVEKYKEYASIKSMVRKKFTGFYFREEFLKYLDRNNIQFRDFTKFDDVFLDLEKDFNKFEMINKLNLFNAYEAFLFKKFRSMALTNQNMCKVISTKVLVSDEKVISNRLYDEISKDINLKFVEFVNKYVTRDLKIRGLRFEFQEIVTGSNFYEQEVRNYLKE